MTEPLLPFGVVAVAVMALTLFAALWMELHPEDEDE